MPKLYQVAIQRLDLVHMDVQAESKEEALEIARDWLSGYGVNQEEDYEFYDDVNLELLPIRAEPIASEE